CFFFQAEDGIRDKLVTGVQTCGSSDLRYCIRARDRPGIYLELRMATAAHALTPLPQLSREVAEWVDSVRELTQPRAVHWCEGVDAEARELTAQLLRGGELTALNPEYFPGCHLYRSAPADVARVE